MRASTEMHQNRTGTQFSPKLSRDMEQSVAQTPVTAHVDPHALDAIRSGYYESAEPIGSSPSMTTNVAGEATAQVASNVPEFFMDKLGERLAFERSGTRLYETVRTKVDAEGSWDGGPSVEDLDHIRHEEWKHFNIVHQAISKLGGDPTAITPSADAVAVASEGLLKLVTDPRASVADSLEALLVIELTDNDSWQRLSALAEASGQSDLAEDFETALNEEEEHLHKVRGWLEKYAKHSLC